MDFHIVYVPSGIIYVNIIMWYLQLKHLTPKITSFGISKMWSTNFFTFNRDIKKGIESLLHILITLSLEPMLQTSYISNYEFC